MVSPRGGAEAADRAGSESAHDLTVTVVLPCLDEASSVGLCVEEALTSLADAGIPGEVIVADNGSDDGSPEVAIAAGARVVHESNRGYGSALLAGFREARGDVVVMADADFTYDLGRIPDLVAPIERGDADLVLGSRLDAATRATMPWLHRFVGTPVLTFLAARACGRRVVSDSQSGFRAFRRDSVAALGLHSTGMELASEMLIRAARGGLRITEVQTGYRPRIGESKLDTFADGWRHLHLILLLAPDLVLVGPGAALLLFGLVLQVLSSLDPSGVASVGSLRWQPVFFSTIAIVLGVQALLAGAVLAHHSSVSKMGVQRRFAFVERASFPNRCMAAGVAAVAAGLAVDAVLFVIWLDDRSPPTRYPGYASLAQSLIIVGGTLTTFGIVTRFQRARAFREHVGARRASATSEQRSVSGSRPSSSPRRGRSR